MVGLFIFLSSQRPNFFSPLPMASRTSSTDKAVASASNKKKIGGLKPKLGCRNRVSLHVAAKQARVLSARFTQPSHSVLG